MDHFGNESFVTIQQILLGVPQTYGSSATWNPSDKGTTVTLSNGNLTAQVTPTGSRAAVRATNSKASGKWYWEVTINAVSVADVGVANSTMPLTNYIGQDNNSWGYLSSGTKVFSDGGTGGVAYGASFTTGDVISVAVDLDAGTISFYKNGTSQGQAFTGLTGTLFPAVSNSGTGTTSTFVANFGATPFLYAPPVGYSAL